MSVLKKRYFVITFGCQMNEADSLWLEEIFEKCGYKKAASLAEADVFLINSCSVRQAAEDKVYGLAPRIFDLRAGAEGRGSSEALAKGEKELSFKDRSQSLALGNSPPAVILTGCMVGSATGERRRINLVDLKRRLPWVDYFVSPDDIFGSLPAILLGDEATAVETLHATSLQRLVKPGGVVFSLDNVEEAYVPVMRGCDHFCSYCVVPYGRGRERSRPMEEIVAEVEELVKQGVKKITLLGQNVNSYGKELKSGVDLHFRHSESPRGLGGTKNLIAVERSFANAQDDGSSGSRRGAHPFAELLRQLHKIDGLESIWFLTSNPWDFTGDLIDALALPKIEKYLHLPVQSGDDDILKKMNRPYTADEYKGLVGKIRKRVPEIRLGTDLIVGFPGETEAQFQHTVDLVRKVGFEGAFIAIYSPRPGTAAAKIYEDNVSREEKKRRHAVLTQTVEESKPA